MWFPEILFPEWCFRLRPELAGHRLAGSTLADVLDPGQRPSPRAGPGLDWQGRREYAPGDSLNLVDWRTFARHADRDEPPLFVKVFDAERANRTTMAVDCSASMNIHPVEGKLATALGAAALLAAACLEQGDPAELVLFGGPEELGFHESAPMHVRHDLDHGIDEAEALAGEIGARKNRSPVRDASPWGLLVDPHAGLKGSRQTLVLVSDFFETLERLTLTLEQLRRDARTLLAIRVISESDRNPFRGARDVKIVDVERPGVTSRVVAPDREEYRRNLEAHLRAVEDLFTEEGVLLADVPAVGLAGDGADPCDVVQALVNARILEPI